MKFLLIRHAEMRGDPFIKPTKPVQGCLSENGIKQAKKLRKILAKEKIDIAFSSSYGRAIQTAEIALGERDIPIKVFDFLCEWQPDLSLKKLPSTQYEKILKQNNDKYAEELWKTELGEGTFDMYARICPPFLSELKKIGIKAAQGGFLATKKVENLTLAIFAHGGSLNILLSFLLDCKPFPIGKFVFRHTGIAHIEFIKKKGIFYPQLILS